MRWAELCRVLKEDGVCVVQVPVWKLKTVEDPAGKKPGGAGGEVAPGRTT